MAKAKRITGPTAAEAWATLPPMLAYLRPALGALSRQRGDRLCSGDGDFSSFDKSWKSHVQGLDHADVFDRLVADVDALEGWLKSHADPHAKTLGPAWVLFGYMRGKLMFEEGGDWRALSAAEPVPPPPMSPRLTFELPPGVTAKRVGDDWDIRARGMVIAVSGLSEELFHSLRGSVRASRESLSEAFPPPPGFVEDVTWDFRAGAVHGWRVVHGWGSERLPFAASYLLVVPGGHADVRMVAKGKKRVRSKPFRAAHRDSQS